jgi:Holliday junction DNA helicase RuvA
MIDYVKGEITFKSPTYLIVEAGGIGYGMHISLYTYGQIEKLERAKVLTHFHVKEDSHTLYGFSTDSERNLFRHLISVSGVGPGTARLVLSAMQPEEVRSVIVHEQVSAFKQVKGIGPKTAKRIILDLKDKLVREGFEPEPGQASPVQNPIREEAVSALLALGFSKVQVQRAVNRSLKENPELSGVENLIKEALKQLS